MLRTAIVMLLLSPLAFADEKADLKALAGTWTPEKFEIEGGDQSDAFKDVQLVIDGGKYTVTVAGKTDSGTISVDNAKNPKTMDVTGTDGPNKGKTYLCIYELKDGKLTICYGLDDKVRPTKFESAKGSKTMLAVYKKK